MTAAATGRSLGCRQDRRTFTLLNVHISLLWALIPGCSQVQQSSSCPSSFCFCPSPAIAWSSSQPARQTQIAQAMQLSSLPALAALLVRHRHHTQEEPAPMHALGLPKLLQHKWSGETCCWSRKKPKPWISPALPSKLCCWLAFGVWEPPPFQHLLLLAGLIYCLNIQNNTTYFLLHVCCSVFSHIFSLCQSTICITLNHSEGVSDSDQVPS